MTPEHAELCERLKQGATMNDMIGQRQAAHAAITLLSEENERLRREWDAVDKIAQDNAAIANSLEKALREWLRADDIGIGLDIRNAREAARAALGEKP